MSKAETQVVTTTAALSRAIGEIVKEAGGQITKSRALNTLAREIAGPKHNWGYLTTHKTKPEEVRTLADPDKTDTKPLSSPSMMTSSLDILRERGFTKQQVDDLISISQKPNGLLAWASSAGNGKSTSINEYVDAQISASMGRLQVEHVQRIIIDTLGAAALEISLMRNSHLVVAHELPGPKSLSAVIKGTQEQGRKVIGALQVPHSCRRAIDVLHNLKIEADPDAIFDPNVVSGVVVQEIVGTACKNCSVPASGSRYENSLVHKLKKHGLSPDLINNMRLHSPHRCDQCEPGPNKKLQYTVAAEVVSPDRKYMELARIDRNAAEMYWLSELGGMTMDEHRLLNVLTGATAADTEGDKWISSLKLSPYRIRIIEQIALSR